MGKRLTDTELHDRAWYMTLSCRLKCAVRYLFDKCDNIGVWEPNYILAATYVGESFTEDEILAIDGGKQFERLANGKIFLPDFCDFQYGTLTTECRPHRPVIAKLKKTGLYDRVLIGYHKGTNTPEEKEQEKDPEKEPEKEKDAPSEINPIPVVVEMKTIWLELKPNYPVDRNSTDDEQALFTIGDFIAQQLHLGWLPKSAEQRQQVLIRWRALANWILSDDFYRSWALITLSTSKTMKTIWQKSNDNGTIAKNNLGKIRGRKPDPAPGTDKFAGFNTR